MNQRKKSGPNARSFLFGPSRGPSFIGFWHALTDILRRIEDIIQPTVTGMGFDLVRVSMSRGGGTLQIMIEPADGRPMDVEDCATRGAKRGKTYASFNACLADATAPVRMASSSSRMTLSGRKLSFCCVRIQRRRSTSES